MITRRSLLGSTAAAALARPSLVAAQNQRVLKFVPQADLALLDPIQTTGLVTRNHGAMVFDTLYGIDAELRPHPQMVEGHRVEEDGRRWTLTLRPGLTFHDGERVLARDCVASIRRWGSRDAYAQSLMAVVEELSAPDDTTIVFRLKKPFPLLPDVLGKPGSNICAIMPERLASRDGLQQITEMVGSGPFRFVANERIPGSRAVYQKFADYKPREGGAASYLAGPKVAHFDRVEWLTIPDAATAAAALQQGEIDWWDQPIADYLPTLQKNSRLKVEVLDTFGFIPMIRFNHQIPPFNRPEMRRALFSAIQQSDYMIAIAGEDRSRWKDNVGYFTAGSPMANDAGMEALRGPRSIDTAKRALEAAGYKGERIVFPVPTDFAVLNAMSEVAGDMMRRVGLNLDYQALDWGTVLQRVASRNPVEQGGWHVWCNYSLGVTGVNPAAHTYIRGHGTAGTFGWPEMPKVEALRQQWFDAPDLAAQKALCVQIQQECFAQVPYLPLGAFYQPTAYRADLSGMLKGFPIFWNVRRG